MELETERLLLRSPNPRLAFEVDNYLSRNCSFFTPYLPASFKIWPSIEERELELRLQSSSFQDATSIRFYLSQKEFPNKIIGDISFTNIIRGAFQSCFMGYKLGQQYNNLGLTTEALAQGIDYIFKDLHLHRIEANIMPRNQASIKVIQKLGFEEEGLAKNYLEINGVWEDHVHYSLINEKF